MRELRFNPGEVIIKENSFGSSAYILKSGSVDVTKKAKNRDIVLATLEAEEIFGELGLIDDRPRSASVIAKTGVIVDEIVRDDFLSLLEDKAKFVIPILKTLFERLRQANEIVVSLENQLEESAKASYDTFVASVNIEGLTEKSRSVLKNKVLTIKKFPFKIGRESTHSHNDIFIDNDLFLSDEVPFNVSRNHLSINHIKNNFYVLDRGSRIGTIVNDKPIGGKISNFKSNLIKGDNIIILGDEASPFKFKIIV